MYTGYVEVLGNKNLASNLMFGRLVSMSSCLKRTSTIAYNILFLVGIGQDKIVSWNFIARSLILL